MNIWIERPWAIVFFVGWILYLGIRGRFARRTNRLTKVHRQIDGLEKFLLVLVIGTSTLMPLLYLFTPLLRFADYRLPVFVPWVGLAVMLLAIWLFWRSHADLGDNWSVSLEVREEHKLVTQGVYRSVRHPMYTSIFLWCIAQGLLLPNWLAGWSALATFLLMYVLRVAREERMMCEFFGEEYRAYMGRTGRLWPRMW